MPYFNYHALDKKGQEKTGTLIAEDKESAITDIKRKNLYVTKIYQIDKSTSTPGTLKVVGKKKKWRLFSPKVKSKDLINFIRDFSILLDSGIPITKSLDVLRQQTASPKMQEITEDLKAYVESGHPLSEGMTKYEKVFPELFVNLIRAGEIGGGKLLAEILKRLSDLCENTERMNARIKSALTYPIVVLSFAFLVVVGMMTFVLPRFFAIYEDLDLTLPQITSILINISLFFKNNFLFLVLIILVMVFSGSLLFKLKSVRLFSDGIKLKLPVFGEMFSKVAISRFSRNLGALLNSGVPILQAFEIVKDVTGNLTYAKAISSVKESIREGESIAAPLSQFKLFPPVVINMISVGEETGKVGNMLIKIANKYDEEVEVLILQLTSLLEPFLILFLGVFIGFIIIALFYPLVTLVQQLSV